MRNDCQIADTGQPWLRACTAANTFCFSFQKTEARIYLWKEKVFSFSQLSGHGKLNP